MIKFPTSYLMGNIYELYYFYPTCIASGFIYELNYLYPAPSASGKHLLLSLVYTVSLNLATCFLSLEIFFTISWLIICRNSVVKYKFKPLKLLENALFSAFYFSKLFIVGNFFNFSSFRIINYHNHCFTEVDCRGIFFSTKKAPLRLTLRSALVVKLLSTVV